MKSTSVNILAIYGVTYSADLGGLVEISLIWARQTRRNTTPFVVADFLDGAGDA